MGLSPSISSLVHTRSRIQIHTPIRTHTCTHADVAQKEFMEFAFKVRVEATRLSCIRTKKKGPFCSKFIFLFLFLFLFLVLISVIKHPKLLEYMRAAIIGAQWSGLNDERI